MLTPKQKSLVNVKKLNAIIADRRQNDTMTRLLIFVNFLGW